MSTYCFSTTLLAVTNPTLPTLGETLWFIFIALFCLLLNAFFVAAEFSIVKVRRSQLDLIARKKPKKAQRAQVIIDNLDDYLSANQFGITIASLGLAIFAESYIENLLLYIALVKFPELFGISLEAYVGVIQFASYGIALAIFTVFHVILGELIPKSIAIQKPLDVTLHIARPLDIFYLIFRLPIKVLNSIANWILRRILGMEPSSESEHTHSSEELALLVNQSKKHKKVTEIEQEILINTLELNKRTVRDIITPRGKVVALDINQEFEENMRIITQSKHTRFPLIEGSLDNIIGLVHIKSVFNLVLRGEKDLTTVKREVKFIHDTENLGNVLTFFQQEQEHLALVVNEFGDCQGLVFLDDVIEELVGDIKDEFDFIEDNALKQNKVNGSIIVRGELSLHDFCEHFPDIEVAATEVSTIGGYIIQAFESFPTVNEVITLWGYDIKVLKISNRTINSLEFTKLKASEEKSTT